MFRPFLYALGLVVVLAVGAFSYFVFAPLPVDQAPVTKDIPVTDILKTEPAPVPAAQPAAGP